MSFNNSWYSDSLQAVIYILLLVLPKKWEKTEYFSQKSMGRK